MTRTIFPRFVLPLLVGAALFAACSGDDPIVNPTPEPVSRGDGVARTLFSAGPQADAPGAPGLKSMINSDGTFYWTLGDNIHIFSADGSEHYIPFATNIAHRKQACTDFYVDATLTDDYYDIFYTGKCSDETDPYTAPQPDRVTIKAEQYQEWPNDSEHLATDGDCGVARAHKLLLGTQNYDYSYRFNLEHKAAYLLLLPRTETALSYEAAPTVTKIEVEDTDGKPLAGTFPFSSDGIDTSGGTNTSSKITLTCGDGSGNKFALREEVDTALNGAYIVMTPGKHNLKITYHLSNGAFSIQTVISNTSFTYSDPTNEVAKTLADNYTYSPNKLRRISHELAIPTTEFVFDMRESYYMWDAEQPLWRQQSDQGGWNWTAWYYSNPSFKDYSVLLSEGTVSAAQSGVSATFEYPFFPCANGDYYIINRNRAMERKVACDYTYNAKLADPNIVYTPASASATYMPSANKMEYYLKYGKPRYDNTTYWWPQGFRGSYTDKNDTGHTLCQGGVWLLKWEKILEYNPSLVGVDPDAARPDGTHSGSGNYTAKLPWGQRKYAYDNASNAVKQRPSKDGLNEDDYFFLPALGHYADNYPNTTYKSADPVSPNYGHCIYHWDKKTLRLCGVQGNYWSSTVVPADQAGQTPREFAAYTFQFTSSEIYVNWLLDSRTEGLRRYGMVAGTRPDGTPWFQ